MIVDSERLTLFVVLHKVWEHLRHLLSDETVLAGMLALRVGLLVAEGDGAELEQLFAYASHRVSRPLTTSLGSMV